MKSWKCIILLVGIVLCAVSIIYSDRRIYRDAQGEPPETRVDTLVIHDTIKVTVPVYVSRRVVDSVPYPVTDTIRMRDTLYVLLERQQVTWEDSLARVYASGVNPHVDSVIHFTQDLIITKEIPVIQVKKTKWGLGFQAGFGAGTDGLTPYLGVGVSYNILSW